MARVFSQKLFSAIMGNVSIYSVGIESVYQIVQTGRIECFAGVSREGLTTRDTRETQLSPSVLTLCIPVMCRAHVSFRRMLSHELPVKTLLSSIA